MPIVCKNDSADMLKGSCWFRGVTFLQVRKVYFPASGNSILSNVSMPFDLLAWKRLCWKLKGCKFQMESLLWTTEISYQGEIRAWSFAISIFFQCYVMWNIRQNYNRIYHICMFSNFLIGLLRSWKIYFLSQGIWPHWHRNSPAICFAFNRKLSGKPFPPTPLANYISCL